MVVSITWQHCKCSSEQLNCTQFDQLILRKIIKIVAIRCHILRLKCTKFDFGWGSLQRSPRHLAGFKGPYFYGEGREREEGRGRWEGMPPPIPKFKYATGYCVSVVTVNTI